MSPKIDKLNCLLLVAACFLAWVTPFGLLVLAYAILGPLHYWTEIFWLEDRQCFLPKRQDSRWLIGLALVGTVFGLITLVLARSSSVWWNALAFHTQQIAITVALIAVAIPLVLWKYSAWKHRALAALGIAATVASFYYLYDAYGYYLLFAVWLPTVVHVYVFTGMFMLSGILKSKGFWGAMSLSLLIAFGIVLLFIDLPFSLQIDTTFTSSYMETLGHIHQAMLNLLNTTAGHTMDTDASSLSAVGMRVSRFLAFAYTYHYLNWFSKTSLIGWHHCQSNKLWKILMLWGVCVVLYAVDYSLALSVVGTLSLLHVFYELPLNWRSLQNIVSHLIPFSTKESREMARRAPNANHSTCPS